MGEKKLQHINIPIFIPHEGCPNDCVFCNQHSITNRAQAGVEKADRNIRPEIDAALETIKKSGEKCEVEIAFFGGSFTGIERCVMTRLLEDACSYIKSGKVASIRLSTRPDFIDGEILEILKKHGVRHIELGIQSMNDKVLLASHRGHTALQTQNACKLITEAGFSLTGQMMIGLPESTLDDELTTARLICSMGADSARIYPTVVFHGTKLCEMAKSGAYSPLSDSEGAYRAAMCMRIFEQNGVKLLRVGLQSGEGLSKEKVFAGASHAAIGEMAASELYLLKIFEMLPEQIAPLDKSKRYELTLLCPAGKESQVVGHGGCNRVRLKDKLSKCGINVGLIKVKGVGHANDVSIAFRAVELGEKCIKKPKRLHITNGECYNNYFCKATGLAGIPFNEALMSVELENCEADKKNAPLFTEKFLAERSTYHGVTTDEYKKSLAPFLNAFEKLEKYDEVYLYFGEDAFCVCNMITVLAFLEQKSFGGKVFVRFIDDEDFSRLDEPIEIKLGSFGQMYENVMVKGRDFPCDIPEIRCGIKLYFDFSSPDGKLAKIIKEMPSSSRDELLIKLLENSREYGMSDILGLRLIDKIRGNQKTPFKEVE